MRLSAPIFRLKKQARMMARERRIPLHQALNHVAKDEGFASWSLLSARHTLSAPTGEILNEFASGDLVLLAGRPFQGKTTMGLSLVAEACRAGRSSAFFTLYLTEADVVIRLEELGISAADQMRNVTTDASDRISASYIIERLDGALPGTVVVVDYLQVLDHRRDNPPLDQQVRMLQEFARESGAIIVLLSQVDRLYETTRKPLPDLSDVHLPNPIDLSMFTKTCFINDGALQLEATA